MPEVIFPGPEGRLEGRYQHAKQPNAPLALLLHPHPEHGGTMNNKIVYHLYHQERQFTPEIEAIHTRLKQDTHVRAPLGLDTPFDPAT